MNRTAKAAIFMGAGKPFEIKEYELTAPKAGKALLKLLASGVCGTDVHIHCGRLGQNTPLIIGHEFVGEIVELGEGSTSFKVGDKVIFNMAEPCGECELCKAGDSANCINLKVSYDQNPENPPHFFGGYAEYAYADFGALVCVPDAVDYMAASAFPCAGPTIIHSLKLGGVFANKADGVKTAIVQGAGPLGLFSALWLTKVGVDRVIVSVHSLESPRAKAVKSLCNAEIVESVNLGDIKADLVIECSGNPAAFVQGCDLLRNRGLYLVPGQYSDSGKVCFSPEIITFKAIRIIGSSQYDKSDVYDYAKFLEASKSSLPAIASLIKGYKIDDVNEAIEAAKNHKYGKVVFIP